MGLASDLRVLNLSPAGAMLEHADRLFRGQPCVLGLQLGGGELRLGGHVAWCLVHSVLTGPHGEEEICYRSGLHFSDLPPDVDARLQQYLDALSPPGLIRPPAGGKSGISAWHSSAIALAAPCPGRGPAATTPSTRSPELASARSDATLASCRRGT